MRSTLRMLGRRPGFFLPAALTLALGIVAAAVVFSFTYGVLLSPLPYANAARLALLWEFDRASHNDPGEDLGPITNIPPQDFAAWQRESRAMQRLDALTFGFYAITEGASPTEVIGGRVTRGFFDTLGVRPVLGRAFAPGDPDDVVVLGYKLWQSQYGGDRSILGRQVVLSGAKYTVLGVLPAPFFFYLRDFALWTPLTLAPNGPRPRPLMGVGLLAAGVTTERAQQEFDALAAQLPGRRGIRVTNLRAQYSRFFRPITGVLLAAVGFLLLIACANVAGLLLARGAEREREMAVRAALGAGRGRIVRQLLAENLVLALAAGAAAVALALLLVPLARTLLPMQLPIPIPGVEQIGVGWPVLLFSSALSVATVLIFGLAPALRSASAALGARSTTPGPAQRRFLDAIVVAEIALSVLLLTGAGLTMRSVYALFHSAGFRVDHILTFRTPTRGLAAAQSASFFQEVLDRVRVLPGVRNAAASYSLPGGGVNGPSAVFAQGGNVDPAAAPQAGVNLVSGDFFATLHIPLFAGRSFSARDGAGSDPVAILSAGLALKLFGADDPLGRLVRVAGPPPDRWLRVVGIAGDVHAQLSGPPDPTVYRPFTQETPGAIGFMVHTAGQPLLLAPAVEKIVWQLRPGQPVTYLAALEDDLDQQQYRQRLSAIGLGWFAALGLVLACAGIYALLAYWVKQRNREFGVRLAVGATAGDVTLLVLRRGGVLIGAGLLLGTVSSLVFASFLRSALYGAQGVDASTLAGAAAILAAAGISACYLPARKAAKVDPVTVLNSE